MRHAVIILAALAAAPLSGCNNFIDNQDRAALTQFRATGPSTFEYTTDAVIHAGESVSTAPVSREGWLRDWLDANGMCRGGYTIADRNGVRAHGTLTGDVYKVTYTGRCV